MTKEGEAAGEQELLERVQEGGEELDVASARRILRSPWASQRVIELLLELPHLLRSTELRRELAAHRHTPEVRALRLVPSLSWRDLVEVGRDSRVPPVVRRAAERRLESRLAGLAVGERITIARRAGPGLIARLRLDPHERVIAALLENPRLTQSMLGPLLAGERTRPEILALVARDRRWGSRYAVRLALCRNPRTPVAASMPLLASLKKVDLASLRSEARLPAPLRRRIDLLLDGA